MNTEELYFLFLESGRVITDTRKIKENDIYFALKGDNFNGNEFAQDSIKLGASYAVVDEKQNQYNEKFILVDDVLKCLQDLANFHRNQLNIPFIGITGSNGKTTTKELVKSVLLQKYNVFATEGNLNNHIGVPLSLLSINKQHEIAIIEMGASAQKEIELLCSIAEPNYGLITNIGKAHLEGFGGEEGVFKGKTEMFTFLNNNSGTIFLNTDDNKLKRFQDLPNTIQYGLNGNNVSGEIKQSKPFLGLVYTINNKENTVSSNLIGDYNFSNILVAITIGHYFKLSTNEIKKGINSYLPTNNRSQIINFSDFSIIMDAYNANPSSVHGALLNLSSVDAPKKMAVIGDMLELGEYSQSEHELVVKQLQELKIEAILVGTEFKKVDQNKFQVFDNAEQAGEKLNELDLTDYTILFKGSRGIKLENALKCIEEK